MSINIHNLIKVLQQKTPTTTDDLIYIGKIIESVGNRIQVASSFSTLPLPSSKKNQLFLVLTDNIIYQSNGVQWVRVLTPSTMSWGSSQYGELGDGTTISKSSPTSVAGLNVWKFVNCTNDDARAIRSDDTLWSWGAGSYGKLGDGTTANKSSPVSLVSPFNSWTWKQVNSGGDNTSAIKSDDTLWSWGSNSTGQLGDGTTINRSSPVSVIGGFTWKMVTGCYGNVMAIKSDDTLWSWGYNGYGTLGDGTTINRSSPVPLVVPFDTWQWSLVSGAGGNGHSLTAIKQDGSIWSWGKNNYGSLGDGTTVDKSSPVSLMSPANSWTWKQCDTSGWHTAAIKSDDTLWSWGHSGYGCLGNNTPGAHKSSPVSVVGGFTWKQVSVGPGGSQKTFAIKSDDTLWSWGKNTAGSLGTNNTSHYSSPVSVVGGFTWKQVSAGNNFCIGIPYYK